MIEPIDGTGIQIKDREPACHSRQGSRHRSRCLAGGSQAGGYGRPSTKIFGGLGGKRLLLKPQDRNQGRIQARILEGNKLVHHIPSCPADVPPKPVGKG
jgi:hypothetical protein